MAGEWVVREGDFVDREQVLLEVATDKADTEVRAPSAGKVAKLVAREGETIECTTIFVTAHPGFALCRSKIESSRSAK